MQHTPRDSYAGARQAGAAMVETLVGMIAVLVLAAGLVQFVSLNSAHFRVQNEARRLAGEASLRPVGTGAGFLSDAEFIADWDPGPDGRRHTRDDTFSRADAMAFSDAIVRPTAGAAGDWTVLQQAPGDRVSPLNGAPDPAALFGLVDGKSDTVSVALLPVVRRLVYGADAIDMRSRVWLGWTRGIY